MLSHAQARRRIGDLRPHVWRRPLLRPAPPRRRAAPWQLAPSPPRSWCPHCRMFKPEYEKVAAFCLSSTDIKVYRVDCAAEVRKRRADPRQSAPRSGPAGCAGREALGALAAAHQRLAGPSGRERAPPRQAAAAAPGAPRPASPPRPTLPTRTDPSDRTLQTSYNLTPRSRYAATGRSAATPRCSPAPPRTCGGRTCRCSQTLRAGRSPREQSATRRAWCSGSAACSRGAGDVGDVTGGRAAAGSRGEGRRCVLGATPGEGMGCVLGVGRRRHEGPRRSWRTYECGWRAPPVEPFDESPSDRLAATAGN